MKNNIKLAAKINLVNRILLFTNVQIKCIFNGFLRVDTPHPNIWHYTQPTASNHLQYAHNTT